MTKAEVEKASKDKTWLVDTSRVVDTKLDLLVTVSSNCFGDTWWVVRGGNNHTYWVCDLQLRIATAKDLLELSDD